MPCILCTFHSSTTLKHSSKMASHTFFCCEATCNAIAHVSGGRCDSCADMHSPSRCEWCHSGFDGENSVFLPSESGRFCNKWCEAGWRNEHTSYSIDSAPPKCCADCGVRREATEPELLCDWFCKPCWQLRFGKKHVCSGEMDYELGHKVCDNRDDPFCPQHLALTCNTCGCTAEFRDGERVCWCDSCQKTGCDYEHHCSGENEYRPEERLCEDREDPRCPQNTPFSSCDECGKKFSVGLLIDPSRCPSCIFSSRFPCQNEHALSHKKPSGYSSGNHVCSGTRLSEGWPKQLICNESSCSIRRPLCCADCGYTPENDAFRTFRGNYPLCDLCAEAAYGPPSPVDRRERTGRCDKCEFAYDLLCSTDRRDLCYSCR